MVTALTQDHGLSQRRACQAAGVARSVVRYRKQPDRDDAVIALLQELVERYQKITGSDFKITGSDFGNLRKNRGKPV